MRQVRERRVVRAWPVLLGLVLGGLGVAMPASAAPTPPSYVKYYVVQPSYQGLPENLSEIADRFLGDAGRSTDIFDLNRGRSQPVGGKLTDPAQLRAGWYLVLPWDAVGDQVRIGVLPTVAPTSGLTDPSAAQPPAPDATAVPDASRPPPPGTHCEVAPTTSVTPSDWAQLRMAADQAWTATRGKGVTVAVLDSGVDASVAQLSGHVAVGADVVAGSGRGDTDCLGHGTGVAGLIVAQAGQSGSVVGLAPDARILPIRTVIDSLTVRPSDLAAAIEVAVSADAKVVTVAIPTDLSDAGVVTALGDAARHGVLVVVPATDRLAPGADASVLRVGGVDLNGQPATGYQPGSVDVVAPGVDVAALGINGVGPVSVSGTDYAVAYAAGAATLARAAHPALTVTQLIHRLEATADRSTTTAPDPVLGWGMVNAHAAVQAVLTEEATAPGRSAPAAAATRPADGPTRGMLLAAVVAVAALAGVLVLLRLRRIVRPADAGSGGVEEVR